MNPTPLQQRIERIKQINQQKGLEDLQRKRHEEVLLASSEEREVVLRSFRELIDYLGKRTSKTEVVNQLKEIGTPDALKVVAAVEAFHAEWKSKEDIDLSEIAGLLRDVLAQAEAIPKDLPQFTVPDPIDNAEQLQAIETAVKTLTKELQKKDLHVEAPHVTVDAPQVTVDAPDLKPVADTISSAFSKAIQAIVFPEYKTDNSGVEKLLKQTNKLLDEIADIRSGGGGSGGRATPYEDSEGHPVFPVVQNGGVPTVDTPLATRLDDTSDPVLYIGKAAVGSDVGDPVWQIAKLDTTSGLIKTWAGSAGFTQVWDDRTSLTYS